MASPTISDPDLPIGLPYIIDDMTDAGGGCFPSPGPGLPYDLFGEDNGTSTNGGGMLGGIKDMIDKAMKVAESAGDGGRGSGGSGSFEDMVCY